MSDHLEIERKYAVDVEYALPNLDGVQDGACLGEPSTFELMACYFDTSDLRLAAASITLRRRTGGHDAGWHLKLPADRDARHEIQVPLDQCGPLDPRLHTVPPRLAALVAGHARGRGLVPIAEVGTLRIERDLFGGDGRVLAKIADDTVTGLVLNPQGDDGTRDAVRTTRPCLRAVCRAYFGGMSVTRERQLVETFVDLADTLIADFDVIDFLHTLAKRCVQLLDVDAAGIVLIDQQQVLHAAASSTENARLLELFEMQTDAGPCVDCCRTGQAVVNADLSANAVRWPRFAEAAQASGFVAVHALPLRLRETVIGALNLFSAGNRVIDDDDVRTGQALADVATMSILAQRSVAQAELLASQLQSALTSRVVIEQAKGVLAERRRISVDEAFGLLRDHARRHNLHLSDVARDVATGSVTADELMRTTDRHA